jgi:hypothetical protein
VQDIPLISPAIRAIVDNILFVSVYGLIAATSPCGRQECAFRASILAQIMKEAKDNEDAFYASRKDYRRRFPVQQEVPAEEDGLDESIMQEFFDYPASPPDAAAAADSGDNGE